MLLSEESARGVFAPNVQRKPIRKSLGVAVIAAGRDISAAPPGIKRRVRPGDPTLFAHSPPPALPVLAKNPKISQAFCTAAGTLSNRRSNAVNPRDQCAHNEYSSCKMRSPGQAL